MRPIVLASALLLFLSGCAAQDSEVSPLAQTSETVEASEAQAIQEPAEVGSGELGQSQESQDVEPEGQDSMDPQSESTINAQSPSTSEPSLTATQEPQPTQEPTKEPTQEPAPEPEIAGYTLAEVAERNTTAECWVVVDGGVYDLTPWISEHPGGPSRITQLCGTDGTQQFLGMHGGQSSPATTLEGFYVAPLR